MILFAASLLGMAALSFAEGYERTDGGLTVRLPNGEGGRAQMVRLQVVSDNIIRVEATPDSAFPRKKRSLVIVPQDDFADYTVEERGNDVAVKTRTLEATVDKRSGRVAFRDLATGNTLLSEAVDGKTFCRYISDQTELPEGYRPSAEDEVERKLSLDDRAGYTWRAVFDSPDDEAIYGLGQHQSEEMNYKGRNEELFQYNTKVSIPFIVSTAGYGLLWDSYSYGRWGNPADYQQLGSAFNLYDKDGRRGALTATYTDKDGTTMVRREDSLYFEDSRTVGNLPKGFNLDGANVVFEGDIEARQSCEHRFILYYAGYIKVYIGGRLVVPERWRTAWNPNSYKFEVDLREGERTPLRIEWHPDGGVSYCGLRVAAPQGKGDQRRISIWSEMAKDMDYYFISGRTINDVIGGYRRLTGKAQVMPRWSLGFWQSRERYKTAGDIVATLGEFRKRGIPIDNIVQDWNYWPDDAWGSHQFEKSRYPDPQAMLDSVHSLHGRFMVSVWPKFYCSTGNYKALDSNGWIYRQAVVDSIRDWVGPGYVGSFYDAYASGARKMFWQQLDECLYSKYNHGIDAWWMDASEPNVRDCTPLDYRKRLCGPTALGTSDEYFNAYSIVNADAIYNGQRSVCPNRRVFLLTRSGFAGLQRYSTATWSGDIGTRWEDMRAQMTAGLNFSMSGVPFWGMDIGGFCVEKRYVKAQKLYNKTGEENDDLREWRELQTRWNQFGCFIPLYRTHGQWPQREVWNIAPEGHPAYQSILFYDRLRYRLMPYLYSMAGWVWRHDYTMLRGLAMDFAADADVLAIGDQWMFGPALMACPVSEYKARQRSVYFPKQCGWYDLYTGAYVRGGQTLMVSAPYERIPVFVREGSIVPLGPEIQWSDEKKPELVTLYVYGGADASFELYEDDGTSYDYERGKFSTINICYDDKNGTLTIGDRVGGFEGMLSVRRFNIVHVTRKAGKPLNLGDPKGKTVEYNGKQITVKL